MPFNVYLIKFNTNFCGNICFIFVVAVILYMYFICLYSFSEITNNRRLCGKFNSRIKN